MKKSELLLCLSFTAMLLFGCNGNEVKTTSAGAKPQASQLRIEIIDPEALNVLDTTATIDVISGGFKWTEGPLYLRDSDCFIFSDIPDNKIYKWKEGQGVSTYLTPSGNTGAPQKIKEPGSNGLTLDLQGHLVYASMATGE